VLIGMKAAARRRPILTLVSVGVPASWAVMLLPELWWPGRLPLPLRVLAATWLVLLPTSLLVTAAADGLVAVRVLLHSVVRWPACPAGGRAAALALALPTTTVLVGLLLGNRLVPPAPRAMASELLAVASAVLIIHLAEETVWAGVVQRRLARRHAAVPAAILTAGPFAAVHLPLLIVPGVTANQLLTGVGGLTVLAVVVRLLAATVPVGSRCILPAALLHGCFNASANEGRLLDSMLPGADADLLGTATAAILALSLLWVGRDSRARARPISATGVARRRPIAARPGNRSHGEAGDQPEPRHLGGGQERTEPVGESGGRPAAPPPSASP
jgi:membrane protease YdiL (CAAX protease family)